MTRAFLLLLITTVLASLQLIAQEDGSGQHNNFWQKFTNKELIGTNSLVLKPFYRNSFSYNPNTLQAIENRQRKNLTPYSLESIETPKFLPPRQLLLGQMPCLTPNDNYPMPIHLPDSTIDFKLLVKNN